MTEPLPDGVEPVGVSDPDFWHLRESYTFDRNVIAEIRRAANTGIYRIRGWGAKRRLPTLDDLVFLGASMSRYPLEGYREACGTDVVIGEDRAERPVHLKIPVTIAGMSFGSLSAQAKEALGRGATAAGTSTTTGDGGMTDEERRHSTTLVYQYLPSRYGMDPDHLRLADAIEVVVGQGAKPGGGGHAAGPEDHRAGGRDAHPARGHRPALGVPPSRLDRTRRPGDQDRRAAGDHRLAGPHLCEGGRGPPLLRHRAGGQGWCRRGGGGRHAGRHRGHPGRVHRACRHPHSRGDRRVGAGPAGVGSSPPRGEAHRRGAASARVRTWPRRWPSAPTPPRSALPR